MYLLMAYRGANKAIEKASRYWRWGMNLIGKIDSFPELGNTIVIDGKIYVKKQEPLSEDKLDVLAGANITDEGIAGYYLGFRDAEKHHGIGGEE
jgi:hypothetical protein